MRTFSWLRKHRVALESGDELVFGNVAAFVFEADIPGLVVDAGADNVDLGVVLDAERLGDLPPAVLHAVAQAHRLDPGIFNRRPGVHRHRVGIVEEQRAGLAQLLDVGAEFHRGMHRALAVHDAAGADRVADTLVHAIFQRDADIVGEGLQPADAHAAHHIARAFQSLAAVGGGDNFGGEFVDVDNALDDLRDHVEIVLVHVRQRDFHACEFRHAQNVADELAGEADGAGADDGQSEGGGHFFLLYFAAK